MTLNWFNEPLKETKNFRKIIPNRNWINWKKNWTTARRFSWFVFHFTISIINCWLLHAENRKSLKRIECIPPPAPPLFLSNIKMKVCNFRLDSFFHFRYIYWIKFEMWMVFLLPFIPSLARILILLKNSNHSNGVTEPATLIQFFIDRKIKSSEFFTFSSAWIDNIKIDFYLNIFPLRTFCTTIGLKIKFYFGSALKSYSIELKTESIKRMRIDFNEKDLVQQATTSKSDEKIQILMSNQCCWIEL